MVCLFSVFILPNNTYEHTTENHCMLTFPYIRSIFLSTELYNRLPHLSKQE